ncbi:MAG: ATP synthase F0 subunit B, partial [Firmicutes bacterium]|nr:ATP synthase F0 subunit B [Bacillota bacterium]
MVLLLENIPSGRVFGLDRQTLIQIGIQLFNVSLLAYLLARFLYNPVRDFMRKRGERIKTQLEHAESDLAKANGLKMEYEKKLKEIHQERDDILATAHRLAVEKSGRLLTEAK